MRDEDMVGRTTAPPRHEIGQDLAALSLHELDERMALLRDEIARLEAAKAAKAASRDAAAFFFKR